MKWISVKNKMPKIYQKVLIYTKFGKIEIAEVDQNEPFKFDNYYYNAELEDEVTHWMELPKKPNN